MCKLQHELRRGRRSAAMKASVCGSVSCRCPETSAIVYVDSGSNDGSVELARELGADVIELDMRVPFTAARARNAGFRRLREISPDLEYVQFVDGDCELIAGWLEEARCSS